MILSKNLKIGELIMRIITGTILMVSLMMPAAVIADVTHKVSGHVTITKYKEGDEFHVVWRIRHNQQSSMSEVVRVPLTEIDHNGTYPFEITCEHTEPASLNACEHYDAAAAWVGVVPATGGTTYGDHAQTVLFE
jgi:hypothetical protein